LLTLPLAIDQQLCDKPHEHQPAAQAIEQDCVILGQSNDIYISKGLSQAQTRIHQEQRSGGAGEHHRPEAEEQ